MRPIFRILVLIAIAVLVTLATGEVQSITLPPGYSSGFPLWWITPTVPVCPLYFGAPPCPPPSPAYDWLSFVLDVLFYAAVGFSLLLVYTKYFSRKAKIASKVDSPGFSWEQYRGTLLGYRTSKGVPADEKEAHSMIQKWRVGGRVKTGDLVGIVLYERYGRRSKTQ